MAVLRALEDWKQTMHIAFNSPQLEQIKGLLELLNPPLNPHPHPSPNPIGISFTAHNQQIHLGYHHPRMEVVVATGGSVHQEGRLVIRGPLDLPLDQAQLLQQGQQVILSSTGGTSQYPRLEIAPREFAQELVRADGLVEALQVQYAAEDYGPWRGVELRFDGEYLQTTALNASCLAMYRVACQAAPKQLTIEKAAASLIEKLFAKQQVWIHVGEWLEVHSSSIKAAFAAYEPMPNYQTVIPQHFTELLRGCPVSLERGGTEGRPE